MLKHIREWIRKSGIPPLEIRIEQHRWHVILHVSGTKVACACSPKNPEIAAMKIANDLSRAWAP